MKRGAGVGRGGGAKEMFFTSQNVEAAAQHSALSGRVSQAPRTPELAFTFEDLRGPFCHLCHVPLLELRLSQRGSCPSSPGHSCLLCVKLGDAALEGAPEG